MAAVSVGGFHHHKICLFQVSRIPDQRLIQIADIPGKDEFFLNRSFLKPQLYACRTKQMAGIHEPCRDALRQRKDRIVMLRNQLADQADGILHGIGRNKSFFSCPSALPVAPLGLKLLNVRTVTKHNVTEIRRGVRGVNRSPEAMRIQSGKIPRMINMRVGQKNEIQL